MTVRGVTIALALTMVAAGCSDDGGTTAPTTTLDRTTTPSTTTTTVPDRATSTTTTEFDPESVEGQVEAAYLRSWDVYADAVYNLELDETALAEVYAGDHLETKRNEIERRIENGEAALVLVDHDYTIQFSDDTTAIVIDLYRNHQVLIDPDTKEPVEDDPDEAVNDIVTMNKVAGSWKVTLKERADR